MVTRTKMTGSSNEVFLEELFNSKAVYEIPYFQRSYKWGEGQIERIWSDLNSVLDEEKDVHFLGAIIFHTLGVEPGRPQRHEVIDGQQRLTTIFLLICAIVRWLTLHKHFKRAADILLTYVALEREPNQNSRLHPSKNDRGQINKIFEIILGNKEFTKELSNFRYSKLPEPADCSNEGALRRNFNSFLKRIRQSAEKQGDEKKQLEYVELLLIALMSSFSVVSLSVVDKSNGPVIFDSLNAAQEPMTIGDLVKNGIFARIANHSPEEIAHVNENLWEPFAQNFASPKAFSDFFFPYGLIKNQNLKKNQTYNELLKSWAGLDTSQIIEDMQDYQLHFNSFYSEELDHIVDKPLKLQMLRLSRSGAPSSTLPFVMAALKSCHDGETSHEYTTALLHNLECFLIRRAVCGYEPTGLHAVFKKLWTNLKSRESIEFAEYIEAQPTVAMPSNDEFIDNIKRSDLYHKKICNYFVCEFDRSLGGELPSDRPEIEHILPQTMTDSWKKLFSANQHENLVHTAANLLPVTQKLNGEASQKPFDEKAALYSNDGMYKSTRDLAASYSSWEPSDVEDRAEKIANWAVSRWALG